MAITKFIRFYECEHGGDLGTYAAAVSASGGEVISIRLGDDETGVVGFAVADATALAAFNAAFAKTAAFDFSNLALAGVPC